jgi:hypothetical protein
MHRRLLEESFKRDHHHARLVRLGAADPDFVCASPREPSSRARASGMWAARARGPWRAPARVCGPAVDAGVPKRYP